jgi:hypothetical protein
MRSVTAILFLAWLIHNYAFSQGEINEEEKIFYRNEKTYGFTLNSDGLSAGFRYAKRIDAFRKTLYEAEFAQIKHQKEIKISFSSTQQIGGSFVYGKLNSLTTLRTGLGFQKELFRKEDKGGISIRYFYTFGLSTGFQKPVYYEVDTDSDPLSPAERIKFETHLGYEIERKAPFYVGLNELKVVPGIYGKFGFTFEFSKSDVIFNAIETGIIMDAFMRKIPIMANELNHRFYPAFFVSYRFGKVIDSQFKAKPGKIDKVLAE